MRFLVLSIVVLRGMEAQQPCPATPAWSLCEISLSGTAHVQAEFRSPSHKTYLIQSFTNGANQALRIVPTEPGTWDYRVNGQDYSFTATPSGSPGYIEAANVHHFRYSGSKLAHLWMGSASRQPFTHVRVAATPANDAQIVAVHKAGQTADLMVPSDADLPDLIARYGSLNITWMVPNGMPPVTDQYGHLSTYRSYRSQNGDAVLVEHLTFPAPSVNDFGSGISNTDDFRHALWRTTMDGGYPESEPPNDQAADQMKHWFSFFSGTRFWELEPFFDAGGRRALALEGVDYIVYAETPGPVTVDVEKHSYDVEWFNPVTGQRVEQKNLKTETFTGETPDSGHDWVLHISREGHKAGMLKSYKFESREILMQEVDAQKVPYEIVEPAGETISLSHPGKFAVKLTKETKASKAMRYLWTGEVTADEQAAQILGTGAQGTLTITPDIAKRLPGLLHLRVEGVNGVGKLYTVDRNYQLVP